MSGIPRPEFTALAARRDNLRAERAQATQLAQDSVFQNKLDAGIELWLVRVNKEITELDWILDEFDGRRQEHTDETRIGVPFHTLLAIGMVNGGFLALILYLLFQH